MNNNCFYIIHALGMYSIILLVSLCARGLYCALGPQNLPGKNWTPRTADTSGSSGETTTSAHRDLITQEPRSSLGLDISGFHLHLALTLSQGSLYPDPTQIELIFHEF